MPHVQTFHDDEHLGEICSDTCVCKTSWASQQRDFRRHTRAFAALLTAVQRAGVRVVYHTLFARSSTKLVNRVDALRAYADNVARHELTRANFFDAGGTYLNMWPVYRAYQGLANQHLAYYGVSSLHTSPLLLRDWPTLPDLVSMRLQLGLSALCSERHDHAAGFPCGHGSEFTPLAAFVESLNAQCSCERHGLSITAPHLCNRSGPVLTTLQAYSLFLAYPSA